MLKAVRYIRVSQVGDRDRDSDSYITEKSQKKEIDQAFSHKYDFQETITDADQSGRTLNRPGFKRALELVESGRVQVIAVARLDRFARTLIGAKNAIERIEKAGGILVSADHNIDPRTASGKMMRDFFFMMAEWQSNRIGESWAAARSYALDRNIWIPAAPPVGYKKTKKGTLVIIPKWMPVIREAFHMRARGDSLRTIALYLTAEGVPNARGKCRWVESAVSKLIKNPVYKGQAYESHGLEPRNDVYPAIVTELEWDKAQRVRNRFTTAKENTKPLTGLLRCAGCQHRMTRNSGAKNLAAYYACKGVSMSGKCPAPAYVNYDHIENYIEELFFERLSSPALLHPQADSATLAAAKARKEMAEAELEAWLSESIVGLGAKRYQEGLDLRNVELEEAKKALEDLTESLPDVLGNVVTLKEAWASYTGAEKREIYRSLIDTIYIRRIGSGGRYSERDTRIILSRRTHVCWRGTGPDPSELPQPSVRKPITSFVFPGDEV